MNTGDTRAMAAKCCAIARSGSRCNSAVLPGSSYCWLHDPASAEARKEASRKGGRAKSTAARARKQIPPAMGADELAGWLSTLFNGVMTGRVEPRIGTAASAIARTLLQVRELVEIEERLSALEEAANVGDGRRSA